MFLIQFGTLGCTNQPSQCELSLHTLGQKDSTLLSHSLVGFPLWIMCLFIDLHLIYAVIWEQKSTYQLRIPIDEGEKTKSFSLAAEEVYNIH